MNTSNMNIQSLIIAVLKLENTVKSCKTLEQLESAKVMIDNYNRFLQHNGYAIVEIYKQLGNSVLRQTQKVCQKTYTEEYSAMNS